MSNQLAVFNFNQSQVRIQLLNNEPLFCLSDVAKVLNITNPHSSRFNFNMSGVHKMYTPTYNQYGVKVDQDLLFINEPNLYRVIFRSNKKEAVEFQNWVFDEVLPTIRKTGTYTHTISVQQQSAIQKAVNDRHHRTGEHWQAIYTKLHERFNVPRYQELKPQQFDEVMNWLGANQIQKIGNSDNSQNKRLLTLAEEVLKLYEEHLHIRVSLLLTPIDYNIRTKLYSLIAGLETNDSQLKLISK